MLTNALSDYKKGIQQYFVWSMLGFFDIKLKYRRSLLGPFWITSSISVMVVCMAIIYSQVFKDDIKSYLPYVGCSLAVWHYIITSINESCSLFLEKKWVITDVSLPTSTLVLQLCWKNFIVFAHNLIMVFFLMIFFKLFSFKILFFPLSLITAFLFFFFCSLIISMICARFRDFPPIVASVTQVLMFITPVFWEKAFLTKYKWVININPFYHILEILRCPLLGRNYPWKSFGMACFMTLVLFCAGSYLISKYKHRLPYWVQ